jgi:hypothetical protein
MPRKISEDQTRKELKVPQSVGGIDPSTRPVGQSAHRLYEPPLDMFDADTVKRWFTEKEVEEVVESANKMAIK